VTLAIDTQIPPCLTVLVDKTFIPLKFAVLKTSIRASPKEDPAEVKNKTFLSLACADNKMQEYTNI
jgi:hypothetical protein